MTTTAPIGPTEQEDRLLNVEDLAQFLGVPRQTIYVWRSQGTAPRAVKVGKHLRFRRSDVNAWLEQHADAA